MLGIRKYLEAVFQAPCILNLVIEALDKRSHSGTQLVWAVWLLKSLLFNLLQYRLKKKKKIKIGKVPAAGLPAKLHQQQQGGFQGKACVFVKLSNVILLLCVLLLSVRDP